MFKASFYNVYASTINLIIIICFFWFHRCYLHSGDLDKGLKTFSEYMSSGKFPSIELYVVRFCKCIFQYDFQGIQLKTLLYIVDSYRRSHGWVYRKRHASCSGHTSKHTRYLLVIFYSSLRKLICESRGCAG